MKLKKNHAVLILAVMLLLPLAQIAKAYATETVDVDEVLLFLEDVVMLDVANYEVELLGTTVSNPPSLGGITQITGIFSLQSETSKLEIQFKFRNNTLSWCLLTVIEGVPYYKVQMSDNVHDNAREFLQRYQTFTGDSELEIMKNMLDTVDVTKSTTKTTNNIKISVSNIRESTIIDWKYSFNDADYAGIQVGFREGSFYGFSDKRSIYSIGGTDVNISKEDAIIVSHLYAESLVWTVGNEKVTEFNIVEEKTDPKLLTRSRNESLKLYPYWYVLLYLDDLYPGNVRHIQVMFWADTGELIDMQPVSFGGGSPEESINHDSSLPAEPSELFSNQSNDGFSSSIFIILLIVIPLISVGTLIVIRKKHRTISRF